jgi:hypothetical protein
MRTKWSMRDLTLAAMMASLPLAGCAIHHDPPIDYRICTYDGAPNLPYAAFADDLQDNPGNEERGLRSVGGDVLQNSSMPDEMTLTQLITWLHAHDQENGGTLARYVFMGTIKKMTTFPSWLGATEGTSYPSTDDPCPSAVFYRNIWELMKKLEDVYNAEPDQDNLVCWTMKHEFGHQFDAPYGHQNETEHCYDDDCVMFEALNDLSAYDPPLDFCSLCWPNLGNNLP